MRPLSTSHRLAAAALSVIALVAASPTAPAAAQAGTPTVADYLAKHPGGQALSDNEISYDQGRFVVTLRKPPSANAIVDCPSGWFCFYDRTAFGYPRGRLSDCGWQSLITYGWQDRVDSVYYNLTWGSVEFRDYGTPIFSVSTAARADSDVTPFRNRATEVYRRC